GCSVAEAARGQPIIYFQDLRLTRRFFAAEAEEADLVEVEIDLTADQAVGPDQAQPPGLAPQAQGAVAIAASGVDQPPAGSLVQLQLPVRREGPALGGGLDPRRPMLAQGLHVTARPLLQGLQVLVLEPSPDPALPPAVVTLDHRLEAHLGRRYEHRHDVQAQAQADDPPQGVGV